ncbi:Hypothetical predicted protein, partial [Paramuricea clavata]
MDPSHFALNRQLYERSQAEDKTELTAGVRSKENKNLKLKRLSIDDNCQPYRKSITFSDDHPVKVTAKFDYIGGSRESISADM